MNSFSSLQLSMTMISYIPNIVGPTIHDKLLSITPFTPTTHLSQNFPQFAKKFLYLFHNFPRLSAYGIKFFPDKKRPRRGVKLFVEHPLRGQRVEVAFSSRNKTCFGVFSNPSNFSSDSPRLQAIVLTNSIFVTGGDPALVT